MRRQDKVGKQIGDSGVIRYVVTPFFKNHQSSSDVDRRKMVRNDRDRVDGA